jgi:hypothetical protein
VISVIAGPSGNEKSDTVFGHSDSETTSAPTQPTWAVQQVGSYLWYTGRRAGVVAKAAFDPQQTSRFIPA